MNEINNNLGEGEEEGMQADDKDEVMEGVLDASSADPMPRPNIQNWKDL
jgi:hypothetical protein